MTQQEYDREMRYIHDMQVLQGYALVPGNVLAALVEFADAKLNAGDDLPPSSPVPTPPTPTPAPTPPVTTPTTVTGRFRSHTIERGFIYEYDCPECGRTFIESAPEVSAPSICHSCLTGTRSSHYPTKKHRNADES